MRDLELVQGLFFAPMLLALFQMPWVPVFITGIRVSFPSLGEIAATGGNVHAAS